MWWRDKDRIRNTRFDLFHSFFLLSMRFFWSFTSYTCHSLAAPEWGGGCTAVYMNKKLSSDSRTAKSTIRTRTMEWDLSIPDCNSNSNSSTTWMGKEKRHTFVFLSSFLLSKAWNAIISPHWPLRVNRTVLRTICYLLLLSRTVEKNRTFRKLSNQYKFCPISKSWNQGKKSRNKLGCLNEDGKQDRC